MTRKPRVDTSIERHITAEHNVDSHDYQLNLVVFGDLFGVDGQTETYEIKNATLN